MSQLTSRIRTLAGNDDGMSTIEYAAVRVLHLNGLL